MTLQDRPEAGLERTPSDEPPVAAEATAETKLVASRRAVEDRLEDLRRAVRDRTGFDLKKRPWALPLVAAAVGFSVALLLRRGRRSRLDGGDY